MLSEIKKSLFDSLESKVALWATPLTIYYDNVQAQVPTANHLRPAVLPATTATIGLSELGQEIGIFQVSVYVRKGEGQLTGIEIAELILADFPRNTELNEEVRIDKYGSVAPSFFVDDWQVTPVSFEYQNIID